MSGISTSNKVLLIAGGAGMDVESYKHELDCVLSLINNGRLGVGPRRGGWGSDEHAAAVQQVIGHAQAVAAAIAEEQLREAESTRAAASIGAKGERTNG